MKRKFTVYGLRFSKTSFGNRINTGFPNLAVATVLTACGIETLHMETHPSKTDEVATVLTACGIETQSYYVFYFSFRKLQQCLPLAVLKLSSDELVKGTFMLQQCLPLAVLKLCRPHQLAVPSAQVATVLTACGIETISCYLLRTS